METRGKGREIWKRRRGGKPAVPGVKPFSGNKKPSLQASRFVTVTACDKPIMAKSSRAASARCAWNSNVYTWPVGLTVLARVVVRDPLPVPDSMTMEPDLSSNR